VDPLRVWMDDLYGLSMKADAVLTF
jgi:hypothetical protein